MLHRVLRGRRALSSSASPWLSESLPASVRSLLAPHGPALLAPRGTPNCMAPGQQVFCNREVRDRSQSRAARFLAADPPNPVLPSSRQVRFDRIEVLGFDYDYTLASYGVELQDLIYSKARDQTVAPDPHPNPTPLLALT